jgi:hypothetical protein
LEEEERKYNMKSHGLDCRQEVNKYTNKRINKNGGKREEKKRK